MKINMTSIYVGIMLPLVLGYMHQKRERGENRGGFPLFFIIGLLIVNYFRGDNLLGMLIFRIRGLFM